MESAGIAEAKKISLLAHFLPKSISSSFLTHPIQLHPKKLEGNTGQADIA